MSLRPPRDKILMYSMSKPAPFNIAYLRAPESRFSNLPDFPYSTQYVQYGCLRMAYIDESSSPYSSAQEKESGETEVFLCLHGQPTWSYLYRKMIPEFLSYSSTPPGPATTEAKAKARRKRVVAPDLFGFGRSDKPTDEKVYTYHFHRDSLLHFVMSLDLRNITLVVQDWGGLLGLTLPLIESWRYKRLIVLNTSIATGQPSTPGFVSWRSFSNRNPDMKIGELLSRSCQSVPLSAAEAAAYDAPFPGPMYKAGVRRFPNLVMDREDMEGVDVGKEAVEWYARGGVGGGFKAEEVFMACGLQDPVLGRKVMKQLAGVWGGGCYWMEVEEGGHFLQEWGRDVARKAIECFEKHGKKEVAGVRRITPGEMEKGNL